MNNRSIIEIIKTRSSVRTYNGSNLPNETIEKLNTYLYEINNSKGIFGEKIRVNLIQQNNSDEEIKLGTYGVIKGARDYITAVYQKSEYGLFDLGYLFEKIVLYCTSLNLGTVWLGGTFTKGKFAKAINLGENELLPIVSPVGIEGPKKSFIAKMFGTNSNKRKDFAQLFFKDNFKTPLSIDECGEYGEVLEMVRLAPSAMNKQPWRILKEANTYHFYNEGKMELSKIDIGIALCHFELSAKEKGLNGEFKVLDNRNDDVYKYVVSWIEK